MNPECEVIETMIEVAEADDNLIGVIWAFGMYRASGEETIDAVNKALAENFTG